ncbi:MAG: hypothetical protein EBZ75_01665, partial [Oxalobacteraceae bacterium]|nr:hypothetical protein [Oxalobacteraceae bacterium]
MRRALLWVMAGLLTASVTALASAPAAWLVPLIDRQTGGRFALADVQGSPNSKQTAAAGNVFGVAASRALVERNEQGVITAVIAEFDPAKQEGGVTALVRRLTTSVGVYQGNTT